jgi:hypothetical protein
VRPEQCGLMPRTASRESALIIRDRVGGGGGVVD